MRVQRKLICLLLTLAFSMPARAVDLAVEEGAGQPQQSAAGSPRPSPEAGRAGTPKPRPPKPFVPTEKISADSAVAFPVDI
jgi:hypothetical protein